MVKVLVLILSLLTSAALAQGTFTTIVSPTTLTVSPTAGAIPVTPTGSPASVVIPTGTVTTTGSPATVLVPNTLTVSEVAGTIPVSLTGAISIYGTQPVAVLGTATVSPTGTLATSFTTPIPITAGTLTTSEVAGTRVVSLTAPVSLSGNVGIGQTITVSLATATPTVSPTGTVLVSSPVVATVTELNGNGYPNRANWLYGSLTTSGTANNVLIKAPAAGKIYVTSLQCGRTDSATSVFTVGFNISPLSVGTSFNIIVPPTSTTTVAPLTFPTPLTVAATTSLQFTPSAAVAGNSLICNAAGFNQP